MQHVTQCLLQRQVACGAEFKGTVVAVTHDRYFLDNVAGWILELDRGHGIPFEGNYSEWLKAKSKRLEVSMHTFHITARHTFTVITLKAKQSKRMEDVGAQTLRRHWSWSWSCL